MGELSHPLAVLVEAARVERSISEFSTGTFGDLKVVSSLHDILGVRGRHAPKLTILINKKILLENASVS